MNNTELSSQVENRMQFVITIAIFFVAMTYTFFKFVNETDGSANNISLKLSWIIGAYIFSYLIFTITKKMQTENQLKWIDRTLLVGIGAYIIPICFMAAQKATLIGFTEVISFAGSLWIINIIVSVTFAFVVLFPVWNWTKKKKYLR